MGKAEKRAFKKRRRAEIKALIESLDVPGATVEWRPEAMAIITMDDGRRGWWACALWCDDDWIRDSLSTAIAEAVAPVISFSHG